MTFEEQLWQEFAEEDIDCKIEGLPIPTEEQKRKAVTWALACLQVMGENSVIAAGYNHKREINICIRNEDTKHRCSMWINSQGYLTNIIWLDKEGNSFADPEPLKVKSKQSMFSGEVRIPVKEISKKSRIFIDLNNDWFEEDTENTHGM